MAEQARRIRPALRWASAVAILSIVGLLAWVFWMVSAAMGKEAGRSKLSFEAHSAVPGADLRDCLENRRIDGLSIYHRGNTWMTARYAPNLSYAENNARHTRVEVIETGEDRVVRFYTRDGAPMGASSRALIVACVAGARG